MRGRRIAAMPIIKSASEIIDKMIGNDERVKEQIEAHRLNFRIGQMVYEARTTAGLTQAQLAKKIGIERQVIAQLEDADFDGPGMLMLQRIATALGRTINMDWSPRPRLRRGA